MSLAVGDRVRWADATEKSIPAYRAMRGTVVAMRVHGAGARVQWDCDPPLPRGDDGITGWHTAGYLTTEGV